MIISFEDAVSILNSGKLVAMPTETVYGLAGRIDSMDAIKSIFATKKRPFFDPLIVHVHEAGAAQSLFREWNEAAAALAKEFWPGPLTLVLQKSDQVNSLITSGLETVGVRCPDHDLARALIEKVGVPLAAPSANLFGRTSPTSAEHVEKEFNSQVPVLDGGPCSGGIESTVLFIGKINSTIEISILRKGLILKKEIETCLRQNHISFREASLSSANQSPGQLKHHYMPAVPLVYCRQIPRCEEHLRSAIENQARKIPDSVEGVSIQKPKQFERIQELILSNDPVIAARELYEKLRAMAVAKTDVIYFVEPLSFRSGPQVEAWSAIRDRLTKASSLMLDEELA